MASIYKRGKKYQVKWRDPDGSQRSRTCPTQTSARNLKREIEACVAEGRRWEPRAVRPVPEIDEILKAYLQDAHRRLGEWTVAKYARYLQAFLDWLRARVGARGRLHPNLLTKTLLRAFWEHLVSTGRHGIPRKPQTARKIMEVVQLAWAWAADQDEYEEHVPPSRKIEMPRSAGSPVLAPRWHEMDTCIATCSGWRQHLAIVLRCTGLRVHQVMRLRWNDFDFEQATLRVRGELGKSRQERRGRIIPVSSHLLTELSEWGPREGYLIDSERLRGGQRHRMAQPAGMVRIWQKTGVREDVWKQRPHHCFRKGFVSELRRAGADSDAVEFLVGHSLGLRGVYTDPDALPLRAAVDLVKPLGQVAPQVITLDQPRRASGE